MRIPRATNTGHLFLLFAERWRQCKGVDRALHRLASRSPLARLQLRQAVFDEWHNNAQRSEGPADNLASGLRRRWGGGAECMVDRQEQQPHGANHARHVLVVKARDAERETKHRDIDVFASTTWLAL